MTAPALVLLSKHDTDAPHLPGVATVSKTDHWDDGGFGLGMAAAQRGSLWVDRPYFTGNPGRDWILNRARVVFANGGAVQVGNELNLPLENWQGGVNTYKLLMGELVLAIPNQRWLWAPPSPDGPDWQPWVYRTWDDYAVHCYGSVERMRDIVQWYLDNTPGFLYITECNPGAGNQFDLNAWARDHLAPFIAWCRTQPRIRMVAYFAWRWDQSPNLASSVDAVGTDVVSVLQRAATEPLPPPVPVTPPQPPQPRPQAQPSPRPPSGGHVSDKDRQEILGHLDVLWGYKDQVKAGGDVLKSAVLADAAKAFEERILAIKAIATRPLA